MSAPPIPAPRMLALDVQYVELGEQESGYAAVLGFDRWTDARANWAHVARVPRVAPYRAGHFFERELPCLLAVLAAVQDMPRVLVVDGYAALPEGRPGLGEHLRDALAERARPPIVVGVSKTRFHGDTDSVGVLRGQSERQLFVSAVGAPAATAAQWIREMHGRHRIPTLLAKVDRLARDAALDGADD